MKHSLLVLLAATAACGGHKDSSKPSGNETANASTAKSAGPDCEGAAVHLVEFQTNGGDKQKVRTAVAATCVNTKWTADAVECVKTLKSLDEAATCQAKMTTEQNLSLEEIINNSAPSDKP